MKGVVAYIKSHKLSAVAEALHKVEGLTGMSVVDVRGFGRGRAEAAAGRTEEGQIGYVHHARIDVMCSEAIVDEVVGLIQRAAHTGLRGDGKIYVSEIERAVRISTGECGEAAV